MLAGCKRAVVWGADVRRPGCRSSVVGAGTRRAHAPPDPRGRRPRLGQDHVPPVARGRGPDRRGRPPADRVDPVHPGAPPHRRRSAGPDTTAEHLPVRAGAGLGRQPRSDRARWRRWCAAWRRRRRRRHAGRCSTTPTSSADDPLRDFLEALVLHLPPTLHLVLACAPGAPAADRPPARRPATSPASAAPSWRSVRPTSPGSTPTRRARGRRDRRRHRWLAAGRAAGRRRPASGAGRSTARALVDRLLARDAVLFEYLAEDVLSAATDAERELLAIAAHLPFVSAACSTASSRADLAPLLARARRRRHVPRGRRRRAPVATGRPSSAASSCGAPCRRRRGELLRRAVDGAARRRRGRPGARAVRRASAILSWPATCCCRSTGPDRRGTPGALDGGARRWPSGPGPTPRLAELRGDLHYLRGAWDDAVASYAEAAALGDPAEPRLARKRATILYLRGQLDDAEAMCAARPDRRQRTRPRSRRSWRGTPRSAGSGRTSRGASSLLDRAEAAGVASRRRRRAGHRPHDRAMLAAMRGDRRRQRRGVPRSPWCTPSGPRTSCRSSASARTAAATTWRRATTRGRSRSSRWRSSSPSSSARRRSAALAYANRGDTLIAHGPTRRRLQDLRRAEGIWERVGSHLVHYTLGQLGPRPGAARAAQRGDLAVPPDDRAERSRRRRPGARDRADRPRPGGRPTTTPSRRWRRPSGPSRRAARCRCRTRSSPPGGSSCAGVTAPQPPERATQALQLGQAHQNRPAVAEALMLRAAVDEPPGGGPAQEARRLWRDLGNPIGEAGPPCSWPGRCAARHTTTPSRPRRAAARRRRRVGGARRGAGEPPGAGRVGRSPS